MERSLLPLAGSDHTFLSASRLLHIIIRSYNQVMCSADTISINDTNGILDRQTLRVQVCKP